MTKNKDMPFINHLEELRKRFMIVLVAHLAVMLPAFSQSGKVLEILMKLNPKMHLIFVEPSEIMLVYFQIAMVLSVLLCTPLTIYELWSFVSAGLYPNEKKMVIVTLASGFIFFALGVIFSYKVVIPISLGFFTRIAIAEVSAMISVKAYISFILTMLIAMGIVFNVPSFIFIATKLGLITPSTLKEYSKHLIVLIFIISAILTPPDVVSQIMMALPMMALLQFSVFISEIVYKNKVKNEKKQ